jgi:acetolactate decarboxylase
MKVRWRRTTAPLLLAVLAILLAPGSAKTQQPSSLYIYSTLDALMAGTYDGDLTIGELGARGNFGIGTYNRLDGELIALDGVFYHAKADGTVAVSGKQDKTPLAFVTVFRPTQTLEPDRPLALAEIERWLDAHLGNLNVFYAVRIEGEFRDVSVRAIAAQDEPYKPLSEVAKTQSVHSFPAVRGILIGIRSPAFSKGISLPGYHWHFLTADHGHGGHALQLTLMKGSAQVETIPTVNLELPANKAFAHADQSKDRTAETKQVEGR